MTGIIKRFLSTPEQGAQTPLYLATLSDAEGVTGNYFVHCKEKPSVPISYDKSLMGRVWEVSAELTRLSAPITAE